jgi:WD40 repeat protein
MSWDNTLRLWNGHSGTLLAILDRHTNAVTGAMELSDGQILSWSGDEALVWDGQSGQVVCGPIRHSDLPWDFPQLLFDWLSVDSPHSISGQSFAWGYRHTAGITSGQAGPACWHGQSAVKSHFLSPKGNLVVSLDSGYVFSLQIYRGARRITVEDYEASSGAQYMTAQTNPVNGRPHPSSPETRHPDTLPSVW